jgi:cell division protein FtsL
VFGRCVAMIVAIGLCAATLLTIRQLRTQAAHELAQTRLRVMEQENEMRRLKAQIATKVTPDNVKAMAARAGALKPIALDTPPAGLPVPQTVISRAEEP